MILASCMVVVVTIINKKKAWEPMETLRSPVDLARARSCKRQRRSILPWEEINKYHANSNDWPVECFQSTVALHIFYNYYNLHL